MDGQSFELVADSNKYKFIKWRLPSTGIEFNYGENNFLEWKQKAGTR